MKEFKKVITNLKLAKHKGEYISYITKYDGTFKEYSRNIKYIKYKKNEGFSIWSDKRNGYTALKAIIFENGQCYRSKDELELYSVDEIADLILDGHIFI